MLMLIDVDIDIDIDIEGKVCWDKEGNYDMTASI